MNSVKIYPSLYPSEAGFTPETPVAVGGVISAEEPITYNELREVVSLKVRNTGDRPVQVGSHFHFFEVTRLLQFARRRAFGRHLNIPATTAIRFEPGDEKQVELVPFGGKQRIIGFNGLVQGYTGTEDTPCYYPTEVRAYRHMKTRGFCDVEPHPMACDTTHDTPSNKSKKA